MKQTKELEAYFKYLYLIIDIDQEAEEMVQMVKYPEAV